MISYDILELNYPTSTITFYFDNDVMKKVNVNASNGFHEYVVIKKEFNYFIDTKTGEIVRIPGADKINIRSGYSGVISLDNNFYRRASQSEVDYDDLIKYQGHNGKMYEHLSNIYEKNFNT